MEFHLQEHRKLFRGVLFVARSTEQIFMNFTLISAIPIIIEYRQEIIKLYKRPQAQSEFGKNGAENSNQRSIFE